MRPPIRLKVVATNGVAAVLGKLNNRGRMGETYKGFSVAILTQTLFYLIQAASIFC